MDEIYAALHTAQRKRAAVYSVMVVAVILMAAVAAMGERWDLPVLAAAMAVSVFAVLLIRLLCCSRWALVRNLEKLLQNQPFADSFLQTTESFQMVFADKGYRLRLWVSETWLVLISTNCSLIRPKESFFGAERVLLEHEYEHAVRLMFTDGSAICRCEHVCDELVEKLNAIR